jgi:N-methylhydantoinase B
VIDPITLAVFRHRLEAIADEMGDALKRTATAPNIKEREDLSCAVFDPQGRLVAQAAHIPVHLGSMPMSVAAALEACPPAEGDVVILNDPYAGGTHLPDITMVSSVELEGRRLGFVATRAHHMDIGGISPGSMPLAEDIHQEGLIIPPVRIVRGGRWDEELLDLIARNVRTPDELRADLRAQAAAEATGAARLRDLAARQGFEATTEAMAALIDYSARAMRTAIAQVPDGRYAAEDLLESSREGASPIVIRVAVEVRGETATIDFTGSHPQIAEPLNAVLAITTSAVLYCFICLLGEDVPTNAGCLEPLRLVTESGSIVDALPPSAVSGGNVETSQRIVDVVLRALAPALPEVVPAAGQGTMNNVTFGGWDPRRERWFAYYETLGGGMGGSPSADGLSGVHVAMSNTRNTPVEALEHDLPVRITHYRLRRGSGGDGRHRGGDGIERGYRFLVPVRGTVISERRVHPPWGLAGGEPGATGRNTLGGRDLGGKAAFTAAAGDVLVVATPGGGGWGTPGAAGAASEVARRRA